MILVFQLNKEYMIGLKHEPFDTNDEGRRDRVKFRDAIASKNDICFMYPKLRGRERTCIIENTGLK